MARLVHIPYLLLVISLPLKGQKSAAFRDTDSITWIYYQQKDWNNVIKEGKNGLRNHVDFHYLRMRLGIAFYEKSNYASALHHFRAALKIRPDDPVALEYLYYSFLYLNRHTDALLTAKKFSGTLKQKLSGSNQPDVKIDLSHSYYSSDTKILTRTYQNQDKTDGSQTLTKHFNLTRLSFSHYLGRRLSLRHQAGYLNKHNYRFYQEDSISYANTDETIRQYQYYLAANIHVGRGLSVSPAFHYLLLHIPSYSSVSQGQGFGQSSGTTVSESYLSNFVMSLSLSKYFGHFEADLTSALSNLNSLNQLHHSLGLTWFPAGNLNYYLRSSLSLSSEYSGWDKLDDRWIFSQMAGAGLFNAVWIEVEGARGDMRNYVSNNGAIIYNSPVITKSQLGASLIVPFIKPGITITLRYYCFKNQSSFITSLYDAYNTNIIDYYEHLFSGGLSWKF